MLSTHSPEPITFAFASCCNTTYVRESISPGLALNAEKCAGCNRILDAVIKLGLSKKQLPAEGGRPKETLSKVITNELYKTIEDLLEYRINPTFKEALDNIVDQILAGTLKTPIKEALAKILNEGYHPKLEKNLLAGLSINMLDPLLKGTLPPESQETFFDLVNEIVKPVISEKIIIEKIMVKLLGLTFTNYDVLDIEKRSTKSLARVRYPKRKLSEDEIKITQPISSNNGFRLSLHKERINNQRLKKEFKNLGVEYIPVSKDKSTDQAMAFGLRIAKIKKLEKVIGPERAWGVLSDQEIAANSFITQYTGEYLTYKEAEERTDKSYFIQISDNLYVDARTKGGPARFVNGSINANCEFRVNEEMDEVQLYATRKIAPGEQLLVNYGDIYKNSDQSGSDSETEESKDKMMTHDLIALLPHDTDLSPQEFYNANIACYEPNKTLNPLLFATIKELAEVGHAADDLLKNVNVPADFTSGGPVRTSYLAPQALELKDLNNLDEQYLDAPLIKITNNSLSFTICDDDQPNLTPLMLACFTKNITAVRALLKRQVNVNAQTLSGKTPLIFVVLSRKPNDHLELIRTLLQNQADPSIVDPYMGRTVLHYCVILEKLDCLKTILETAAIIRPEYIQSALLSAIKNKKWAMSEVLLDYLIKHSDDWDVQVHLRKKALKEWKLYFQAQDNPLDILRITKIANRLLRVAAIETQKPYSKFIGLLKNILKNEHEKAKIKLHENMLEYLKNYVSANQMDDLRLALRVTPRTNFQAIFSTLPFAIENDHIEAAKILILRINKIDNHIKYDLEVSETIIGRIKSVLEKKLDDYCSKLYLSLKDVIDVDHTNSGFLTELLKVLSPSLNDSVFIGATLFSKRRQSEDAKTEKRSNSVKSPPYHYPQNTSPFEKGGFRGVRGISSPIVTRLISS